MYTIKNYGRKKITVFAKGGPPHWVQLSVCENGELRHAQQQGSVGGDCTHQGRGGSGAEKKGSQDKKG